MTTTRHVDEETLITAAADPSLRLEHIEECPECQRDVAAWRRIAVAVRDAVASTPPPSEDLVDRIVAQLSATAPQFRHPERPIRRGVGHAVTRRTHWLAAAMVAVLVVATVVLMLSVDSSVPSSASILANIRHAPNVVASASKSVDASLYATVREQNGLVVMNYRSRDVFNPETNAFQLNVATAYPGQVSSSQTFSSDGSLVYLPCNTTFELIGQKPCVAYPAQRGIASDRLSVTLLRRAQGPLMTLGTRSIDGIEATGYRLTVPATAYIAGAEPSERSLLGQELATTKYLRMDVWSDDGGLPVELDYSLNYRTTSPPALLTETVQERLRYSQTVPRLVFPSRGDVLVVPSLQAAEHQLTSYAAQLEACGGPDACGVRNQK